MKSGLLKKSLLGALAGASLLGCAGGKEAVKKPVAAPLAAAPAARPVEVNPADIYQRARVALAAGDYPAAGDALESYLMKEPKSAAANFDAGWVAEQRQQLDKAAGYYKKALEIDPGHLGAALNLARVYRLWERYPDAEGVLRAALGKRESDPKLLTTHLLNTHLLNALATVLRLEKKTDEAEATLRRVLVRKPDDADAYKNLALIELDRDRPRLAEIALANARKYDPNDPGTVNNQGLLALKQGDVVTAKAKFDEATKMSPGFGPAWANLGALALQYRDYPAAAAALAKACAADPARYQLQLANAWALDGLKKPAEARAAYERVLALKPGQDDALYGKAAALRAEGKLPEAMAAFKAYVANDKAPRLKDATAQISQIDLRLKNPPKAAVEVARREPAKAGADISKLELPPGAAGSSEPALNLPSDLPLGLDDQLALPPSVSSAAPAALPSIPAAKPAAPAATAPAAAPAAPKASPETKPSGTGGPAGGAPDSKASGDAKPASPAAAK